MIMSDLKFGFYVKKQIMLSFSRVRKPPSRSCFPKTNVFTKHCVFTKVVSAFLTVNSDSTHQSLSLSLSVLRPGLVED